ncbi:IclR family transcriptional regulator [Paenarthrobacter nicotinovorans]|uniref:IclR family transcriptional regulator n=1 Tax=Paenarthrobacter nicotinovorans TaxID=29320 RepID=UPI003A80A4CA
MKSVLRTLEIVKLVSDHQPIALNELTKMLDIPKSTIQRTLVTLKDAGWLQNSSPTSTKWEISHKILEIRPLALRGGRLSTAAQQPMTELRDATNETIHLCVPSGDEGTVLIARVDCDQPVRTYNPLGEVSPYATTATGKSMLAYFPGQKVSQILEATPPWQFERAHTNRDQVAEQLEQVRKHGYALNMREYRPGVCAVAAPIFDETGQPLASICISMPEVRFDESRVEEWAMLAKRAASLIGR